MRPSKLIANKIDLTLIFAHLMRHNQLTKILIFLLTLLFPSHVLCASASQPQAQAREQAIDTQLLDAIHTLEQKATRESQGIEALNERITRLEQKIAALNYAILAQREHEPNETIQIVDKSSASDSTQHTASSQPDRIIVGSATTYIDDVMPGTFFNIDTIEEVWQDTAAPSHLIPVIGGLLVMLIALISWRTYKNRSTQQASTHDNAADLTFDSDEKNALLVQKLAALRSAVVQSKQRREQE